MHNGYDGFFSKKVDTCVNKQAARGNLSYAHCQVFARDCEDKMYMWIQSL